MTITYANCPLCGEVLFSYEGFDPDYQANERTAEEHMADRHRLRYLLWLKTGRKQALGVWR